MSTLQFVDDRISERLGGKDFGKNTKLYKFSKIKRLKAEAQINKPYLKLIDMGVGEPDKPADKQLANILFEEAQKFENRFYADNGIPEFQEAAANFLKRVFNINVSNPLENIIHSIGTKPALALLPMCFINPGDITLMTVPGYPIMGTYTQYLGGEVFNLPLKEENNFYPDFSQIPDKVLKKSKMLYINYPNNPTGQVATKEFYQKVVEFAYRNKIVVVSDAAYSAITFDGCKPLSFMSIDGAEEVGVEVHSLSKSFNMTGWRLGFLVGNKKIISAFANVKDNTDSGQFRAIQKAGIYALNNLKLIKENCDRYSRRMDMLVKVLNKAGFRAVKPKGTFYCYVEAFRSAKNGMTFSTAEACSEYLIQEALISTVPWDDAGAFLRLSVTFEANSEMEELEIMSELESRLVDLQLGY